MSDAYNAAKNIQNTHEERKYNEKSRMVARKGVSGQLGVISTVLDQVLKVTEQSDASRW